MSKTIDAFWNSKSQDLNEIKQEILKLHEALKKANDENLDTRMKIGELKGKILNEFRPKIKTINVTLDDLYDEFDSIDKQLSARDKHIGLRLDAIEETLYHMQKKENRD